MSKKVLTVLLIEDSPEYATLVQRWLSLSDDINFVVDWIGSLAEGLDRVAKGSVDAILLDLGLPDSRGLATFTTVKTHDPSIPIVVLSGKHEESLALDMVQQGAQDYIIKSNCDSELLVKSLRYAVGRSNQASVEKSLKQRMVQLANIFLSCPDAMIVTDNEGIIQFMNAEALRTVKCPASGWSGRRFHELVPLFEPISRLPARDFVTYMLTNETSSRDEILTLPRGLCFIDQEGGEIMIEGEMALGLMMDQVDNVGAIITFRDVSRPRGPFDGTWESTPCLPELCRE